MDIRLKEHSSWSQLKAVERAHERVKSWPEWKRAAVNYREQPSKDNVEANSQNVKCKEK